MSNARALRRPAAAAAWLLSLRRAVKPNLATGDLMRADLRQARVLADPEAPVLLHDVLEHGEAPPAVALALDPLVLALEGLATCVCVCVGAVCSVAVA